MRRCSQCILPETYPHITFNEQGVCTYCQNHRHLTYLGHDQLEKDLQRYHRDQGAYDALVPVSGGKDSTYVLYYLHARMGKRILAYNYDNGLTHPDAQKNVKRLTDHLGIDLIVRKNEQQRERMTANLKAYLAKPDPAMIPMLCTSCRYGITGNAYKIAKEHDIPVIVIGWSPLEDTPFKEELLRGSGHPVMVGLLYNLIQNPRYASPVNLSAATKDYFHNYSHVKNGHPLLRMLYPNISLMQFYDYIPYDPDLIQKVVTEEAGWTVPDAQDSWQFDCKIKLLQNHFYQQSLQFTATDDLLSAMIREGYIDREQALKRLAYLQEKKGQKLEQLHAFLRECNLENLIDHFPAKTQEGSTI